MVSVLNELTDDQKRRLAIEALEAANQFSYCDEVNNVIEYMGLEVPMTRAKVVLTFDIEVPYNADLDDANDYSVNFCDGDIDEYPTIERVDVYVSN